MQTKQVLNYQTRFVLMRCKAIFPKDLFRLVPWSKSHPHLEVDRSKIISFLKNMLVDRSIKSLRKKISVVHILIKTVCNEHKFSELTGAETYVCGFGGGVKYIH